jgi:hypothetical protein
MDLLGTRRVDPVRQSPRAEMYGYFTHRTDPPFRPYSLPSPTQFRRRLPGHMAFTTLLAPFSRPTTDRALLAISLSLIGPLTPVPPETLPVLLRSRTVLPHRAVRKHLGAVGE